MDKKSLECKVKYVDLEPEIKIKYVDLEPEIKIKYASLEVTKDGKIKWNRPKGKEETEKASQEYVDR